jgi:hypothetical protein
MDLEIQLVVARASLRGLLAAQRASTLFLDPETGLPASAM